MTQDPAPTLSQLVTAIADDLRAQAAEQAAVAAVLLALVALLDRLLQLIVTWEATQASQGASKVTLTPPAVRLSRRGATPGLRLPPRAAGIPAGRTRLAPRRAPIPRTATARS